MKQIETEDLPVFFATLSMTHELRLPILLQDGSRTIGTLSDGPAALCGGAVLAKPTQFFFPQEEVVFATTDGDYASSPANGSRLIVIGFTPADLQCLRFIDRFFASDTRDDLYFRLREGAVTAAVSGHCGKDGQFIPPANGDCDLEFIYDGRSWFIQYYSDTGKELVSHLNDASEESELELISTQARTNDCNNLLIQQASRILSEHELPESFWDEIGKYCIQCTGCNLVCPTCTCFGIHDWRYTERVERKRIWDSCQLAGFMQEAGGHNPLGTAALRTRRRIHHKLAADPVRWGEISCFVCGRCDVTCPSGIGILAVAREIVMRFGNTP